MPVYTYFCAEHGHFDLIRSVAEMRQVEECPDCGTPSEKRIVPPLVHADLEGYACPITGKWIEGRRAHVENLKQHGCRVYEAGETRDFIKNKEQRQKDFDRRTDETVTRAAREMGLIR